MSHSRNQASLETVLQRAGLVSAEQVNQALKQQKQKYHNLSIGEILTVQGKILPQTADFFAQRWSSAVAEQPKQPLGQYLKQAALIDERQIQVILDEQQTSSRKFGELAIAKGWLKPRTVDFFLHHLQNKLEPKAIESLDASESITAVSPITKSSGIARNVMDFARKPEPKSDYSRKVHEEFLQIKRKLLKLEDEHTYSEKTIERVLFWTNGHSLLTQKLFSLIAQSNDVLAQQEEEQVDYLVRRRIIDHWSNNELGTHLQSVARRLLENQHCPPEKLIQLYQQTLSESVAADNSKLQQELLSTGLVVRQQEKLAVANRIYRKVFDLSWVVRVMSDQVKSDSSSGVLLTSEGYQTGLKLPTSIAKTNNSWLNFKNILLFITFVALLGILVNNTIQRIAVRSAFQTGNEFLKQKSYRQAIEKYNQLLERDSNYFQAWTNRGYALAGLQEYEAMRESCSTATIIDPNAVYAWNCQGEALHNLQRDREAIVAFERAISLNPHDPIFSINKSESLAALGDNAGSIASIQQAIAVLERIEAVEGSGSIEGEFAVALTFLGNGYRQQKKYDAATAAYERALNYASQYFPARIGKGITLSRAQRESEAQTQFEQMLTDDKLTAAEQAQTWFYLGKTLCRSEQNSGGISAFNKAIAIKPDYKMAKAAKKLCR
ncbi:MAG: tetratricopeptide repeat protein [Cyanobacteria bacterium J06623_7]